MVGEDAEGDAGHGEHGDEAGPGQQLVVQAQARVVPPAGGVGVAAGERKEFGQGS